MLHSLVITNYGRVKHLVLKIVPIQQIISAMAKRAVGTTGVGKDFALNTFIEDASADLTLLGKYNQLVRSVVQ